MSGDGPYDLAVVGAGIVGMACALAAARRGKRVVVVDRVNLLEAGQSRGWAFGPTFASIGRRHGFVGS